MTGEAGLPTATGPMAFEPAVVRAVSTQSALRSLADLADPAQANTLRATWRETAVVAAMGQLLAVGDAAADKILQGCCAVARLNRSMRGLESLFASALLSTSASSASTPSAEAAWGACAVLDDGGPDLVPVLGREGGQATLSFISRPELASLDATDLRDQISRVCSTHATSPGADADTIAFGARVLVAAGAVASLRYASEHQDDRDALATVWATLPPEAALNSLVSTSLAGTMLVVEIAVGDESSPRRPADWASIWPTTAPLPASADHPYWRTGQVRAALPMAGHALSDLVQIRDRSVVLPVDFYRPPAAPNAPPLVPATSQDSDLTKSTPQAPGPARVPAGLVTPHLVIPGRTPDGVYPWEAAALAGSVIATARAGRLPVTATLRELMAATSASE